MKKYPLRGFAFSHTFLFVVAGMAVLSACQREEVEREPVVRPVRIVTIGYTGPGRQLAFSGSIRAGDTFLVSSIFIMK